MFIGRKDYLNDLESLWRKRTSSIVACRGRRRIGKSTLFREFASRTADVYMEFEDELMLAAPFTGIKEDQKFVVNSGNGTMTLVLDENTPEFYLPVGIQTFTIPLQGYADFEKFVAKNSLYESPFVNKLLISRNDYYSRVYTNSDYSDLIGDRPIYFWEMYMDSEELGPSARAIANGNPEKARALVEKAVNLYEESLEENYAERIFCIKDKI